jgi:hypothetical protein
MTRGVFDFIAQSPAYRDTSKVWHITFVQSDCFWFDMIVNPFPSKEATNFISGYLAALRKEVEETLEKRFIYFFASRPRVRFDVTRPPKYEFLSGKLVLHFLVGRDRRRHKLKFAILDPVNKQRLKPRVLSNDKFITLIFSPKSSNTYSIHDFLRIQQINFGLETKIHYVGITKNPESRPLSRQHRGVADTLYSVSNEENDFFLFVNLFKVLTNTTTSNYMMSFMVANSMTDELSVGSEGSIIERGLVAYFDSPIQKEESSHERAGLEQELRRIKREFNIESVLFDLALEGGDEYFRFGSVSVPAAARHVFLCSAKEKGLDLHTFPAEFDTARYFSDYRGVESRSS